MITTAAKASSAVARSGSTEALIVTGTTISSANGLPRPPVSASSAPSWQRSKSSVSVASRGLSRRFSAASVIATALNPAEAPITSRQASRGRCSPSQRIATSTAADWPKTAIQRSRISVRSRTQAPRASLPGRCRRSAIAAAYQPRGRRSKGIEPRRGLMPARARARTRPRPTEARAMTRVFALLAASAAVLGLAVGGWFAFREA